MLIFDDMSTVAIITPIYAMAENRRLELFEHTLRSVSNQSHPGLVHVVVDDGSTADVQALLKEHADPRIRYIRRERSPTDLITSSNAANLGIDSCISGSDSIFSQREARDLCAVTYLHSDDALSPDSIGIRLQNLPSGFVYTNMALFDESGRFIKESRSARGKISELLRRQFDLAFNHHTTMWSIGFVSYLRDYVQNKYGQDGVFDPRLNAVEDVDVTFSSLETALAGNFDIVYVPKMTVLYRVHRQSITGDLGENGGEQPKEKMIKKHFGENPDYVTALARLQYNPPWSWFYFLSPHVKEKLRPVKDFVEEAVFNATHRKLIKQLERSI